MKNTDRDNKIVEMRQSGMTYNDIGSAVGVSGVYARQVYKNYLMKKEEEKLSQDKNSIYSLGLPRRITSAILRYGYDTVDDLNKLVKNNNLQKIRGIGKESEELILQKLNMK